MTGLKPNRRKDHAPYYLCTTDHFSPNVSQMRSAVKGRDLMNDQRHKRRSFRKQEIGYAVLVLLILIAAFAALLIIGEAVK